MKKYNSLSLLLVLIMFIGCAEDKNLDDYMREKVKQDLSMLKSVEGTYTGIIVSKVNSENVLGAISLDLSAQMRTGSAITSDATDAQPVLVSSIEVMNYKKMTAIAQDSYLDPNTKEFQANIPITAQDLPNAQLSISGKFEENVFNGTIEAVGFSTNGGNIRLEKDGKIVEKLIEPYFNPQNEPSGSCVYSGLSVPEGTEAAAPMTVKIYSPVKTQSEYITDIFIPKREKTIKASLTFENGEMSTTMFFSEVHWDIENGSLEGTKSSVSGSSGDSFFLTLTCSNFYSIDDEQSFTCEYGGSHVRGIQKMRFNNN